MEAGLNLKGCFLLHFSEKSKWSIELSPENTNQYVLQRTDTPDQKMSPGLMGAGEMLPQGSPREHRESKISLLAFVCYLEIHHFSFLMSNPEHLLCVKKGWEKTPVPNSCVVGKGRGQGGQGKIQEEVTSKLSSKE